MDTLERGTVNHIKEKRDMQSIPFTQYLRPNGRKVEVAIDRPKEIYDKAMDIIKAGYRFEAEILTTGQVSLTISDNDEDHDIEVVGNGPEVPLAVDRLITRFHKERLCPANGAGEINRKINEGI